MAAEESISDVATANLQLAQHQQLWAEMEARQETYQQALDMGEQLQVQDANRKEVKCWRNQQYIYFRRSLNTSCVTSSSVRNICQIEA